MEHLQWIWHASRECLPFWTPGSVPHFGDLLMLQLLRPVFPKAPCLSRFFTLNTSWYFLDIAFKTRSHLMFSNLYQFVCFQKKIITKEVCSKTTSMVFPRIPYCVLALAQSFCMSNVVMCFICKYLQEKKKEIWPSPMTKTPIPTENSKTKGQHTQTPPKTSITQQLRTDLGRSVGVTSNPTGVESISISYEIKKNKYLYAKARSTWHLFHFHGMRTLVFSWTHV